MSMTRANNLPFSLGAGESLSIPGGSFEFLYLVEATSGASLRLQGSQVDIPFIVGRRVDFGRPETGEMLITNTGSGTVEGLIFVGSGAVTDSTVVGTVSVVNANKARTESGQAFIVGSAVNTPASEYGVIYLVNPAGSGVKLVVNKFIVRDTSAGGTYSLRVSADYVALEAEASFSVVASKTPINKKIGESAGQGLLKTATSTAATNTNEQGAFSHEYGSNEVIEFVEPFVVSEGMALIVRNGTTAETATASFEWFEESI